jgi:hypothetical protein
MGDLFTKKYEEYYYSSFPKEESYSKIKIINKLANLLFEPVYDTPLSLISKKK